MILADLLADQALRQPHKVAFYFKETQLTYVQLAQGVERCAAGLAQRGVKKGTTFGLLLRNSPEFAILSMALGRLGAVSVPINFLEKPDRVALILNDAAAFGILTSKEFLKTVTAAQRDVPSLKLVVLRDGTEPQTLPMAELYSDTPLLPKPDVSEEDLATLLYTSGTTGQPKGVMLTHRNFLSNMQQCLEAIELSSKDRFLCLLPMFHSFAWTTCILLPFKLGCPIVIIESLLPFDPIIKAIWHYKVTLFVAVPQIFSALAAKIKGPKAFVLRLLNPVRVAISGAAPMPPGVHLQFEKNCGVTLVEGYGLTEAAPVATLNPTRKRKIGTVGKPLPGLQLELRDDEGKEVKPGEVGEIWLRGPNIMKGYYHKPEETAEVLTKDGWLKTGDMGRFDEEGYLSIVDRKKDLIIVKGLNVYPQEIEIVIASIKSVKEVAVVGKYDSATGDEIIRAFVVAAEGQTVDKTQVFALCKEQLAPYKRPKDVIVMDQLPKNALQKILKKELRNL